MSRRGDRPDRRDNPRYYENSRYDDDYQYEDDLHNISFYISYNDHNDYTQNENNNYLNYYPCRKNKYFESIVRNPKYNYLIDNLPTNKIIKNYYIDFKSIDLDDKCRVEYEFNLYSIESFCKIFKQNRLNRKNYINYTHEYKTKNKIFTLLTNCGASIFGGSIRDSFIHDYGKQKFYDYLNKNFNNFYHPDGNYLNNINLIYCDENFHPESYTDRNTIFNDIDAVMNDTHFNNFLLELDSLLIKFEYIKYNNFKEYINIDNLETLISSHVVLTITISNPYVNIIEQLIYHKYITDLGDIIDLDNFKECCFKIDILLCNDNVSVKEVLNKITSNSDFYCNSIYLFNNKLEINEELAIKIKEPCYNSPYEDTVKKNIDIFLKKEIYTTNIINILKKQICEKKAVSINLSKKTEKRIEKIINKGFKITYQQDIFEYIICNDEVCLLCRSDVNKPVQQYDSEETISNNELEENIKSIKFKCCNTYYHSECLLINSNLDIYTKCWHCSKNIDYKHLNRCLETNINDK